MLFLVISIYFIIAFIEIVPLYKKKQKKELLVYMTLLSVALILSILMCFGVEFPSASRIIAKIVKFILRK
jgi:hypothetical protein